MPTLGLRRRPPLPPPVSRSTEPETSYAILGWRLPGVVAPPPEGELRLQPMRLPCNISVDPRLCKGSVFAHRRQHVVDIQKERKEEKKENHYRVNVLRSRLEASLTHFHEPNVSSERFQLPKASHKRPISNKKMTKQPVQLPQLSPRSIDKGFRKLKFVPLRNTGTTEDKKEFPSRVVPAVGRLRMRPSPIISDAPTPPCSQRVEYPIVETAVQTDDFFDEETADLVSDLVATAVEQAQYNLAMEETLLGLTKKTEDIRNQLEREKELKNKLEESSKRALEEKEKEIRDSQKRNDEALASNKLAVITCKDVTARALLRIRALEQVKPRTRSIGQDTRQLNELQKKVELVTAELEKDFFPWMFAKADKIFRNKWTYCQLQNQRKKFRKGL